ncbi:unnamed protein product [Ostreobium quekettii]|uniref:RWD domain-containing protein n=1 Tax=Ostreobium quekettii TaxID=121088 RepID=A0A8S1JAH7_9CHLO|nr:unnamed protein product [Ostreobium quekettii]|eukprot:evm.model.scf_2427.4 EVM.evm.TU.scf_2427.4   scf_2427:20090-23421(+)
MEDEDAVEEECMALEAIFMGNFARLDDRRIRIIIEPPSDEGEQPQGMSLYLELSFPDGYPAVAPVYDLSNTNNVAFSNSVRSRLLTGLTQQAEELLGEQMVYNLVEWVRDTLPNIVQEEQDSEVHKTLDPEERAQPSTKPEKERKEKMTKAQKRRYYDKYGAVEEKPRGWNWVDIISHLSKRPMQADT